MLILSRRTGAGCEGLAAIMALLVGKLVDAENVSFVVLVPVQSSTSEGYTPLAPALKSVFRLAAEHLSEDSALSQVYNVSLAVVESAEGASAAAGLCSAIGVNDSASYAVLDAMGSSSASLIGSLSNLYLHLPILNVRGMAARADSRDLETGGFLLGVKPDINLEMKALVRLILDMKLARDALYERSETEERVWLVHTSDTYGSTAAGAFGLAASNYSVALSNYTEEEVSSRASIEISRTTVLPPSALASFDSEMATLADDDASIIVLLVDGFDPAIVRTIFVQARSYGLTEGVQWFLPDAAALDHVFDHNSTYRDAALAYDMRGALGVRGCMPLTGTGAGRAVSLNQEWRRLDSDEYPGAGVDSLTADGTMDPLLGFAYDSVFLAATAVLAAREEVMTQSGTYLSAIDLDRCPFPVDGPWTNGSVVRDSVYAASSTLDGVTGPLTMSVGDVADGREVDGVTFCAVNLRPHTSQGGRFETIRTLDGALLEDQDGEGFQIVSPFQEEQTYPAGSPTYPFDRPLLQGRHLDVVMKRYAPPFVFVDGDGDSVDDFTGITPSFLESLSDNLGFTYSLRAPPEGTSTDETITMVRNGSADMTGSWITITAERSEYVSFTYPYYDLYLTFVYKPEVSNSVDLWKAFTPFESSLWLALLVALIATVFLLWLFEGAKNELFANGSWGNRQRNISRGLSRSVYVTASLMMAQLTHKPETLEGYLLTLGWLFASFVLAASYTAELASFLTATKLETTSLTVDGLKNGEIPHTNVALLQGGNTQYLYERDFMGCTEDECNSQIIRPQACYSTDECFEMVDNGTTLTAFVDSATAEYQLQTSFCDLELLSDRLYLQHYGLVLPLDSALVDEFQKTTLELREEGILDVQAEVFLDSDNVCVSADTEEDESNMSIGDVSGVFVVLAFFIGLSLCSWCMRRSPVAKNVKARRKRMMGPPPEENLTETFSRLSRKQQKAFALEATVILLQESKLKKGDVNSRLSADTHLLEEARQEGRARDAKRNHAEDLAQGRPVVDLSGGSSMRNSMRWSGFRSNRIPSGMKSAFGSDARQRKHVRVGLGDSFSSASSPAQRGSGKVNSHSGGNGSGNGRRGKVSNLFGLLRGAPTIEESGSRIEKVEKSVPVRSAATKWLTRRTAASPVGVRTASALTDPGKVTAFVATAMEDVNLGVSENTPASIDVTRSALSMPETAAAANTFVADNTARASAVG